eukprot:gnl/TRDRNA2_/TRDRNA2_88731_c0_seq1.p1 gnl/TRDRNA2_/TRDRNA2_88731_c0~~gnl/TRDRNA2_/TRDRNA2_88731_c0_seq1.p1  ORF type:complete len:152 (-),score=22.55 gnl/TRDRNA2_/TRDRNA2_88731_c0_seq1:95-550(-)
MGQAQPCCVHNSNAQSDASKEPSLQPVKDFSSLSADELPTPLALTVRKPDGNVATIIVKFQPLGFNITKETPLVVKTVEAGGHGEALGMKVGMVLMAINNDDLKDLDFSDQYGLLKAAATKLPRQNRKARQESTRRREQERDHAPQPGSRV